MGPLDIVIRPHKERIPASTGIPLVLKFDAEETHYIQSHTEGKYVEMITSMIVADEQAIRGQAFPSTEAFEAYDRIARHIRSIIAYTPPS
jgi:hypothetical protein